MSQHAWVDFRAIKEAVTIRMALEHYGVNWLRKNNNELRGRCPIHKGDGPDAFNANLVKNAFHCFSCKARGNVLDFVAAMEQCTIRDAAVKLSEWFSVAQSDGAQRSQSNKQENDAVSAGESRGEEATENKLLTFELKSVDPEHSYLAERGILKPTAEIFGVGFFPGKGSMSRRVVIPIQNERGQLVAYAGRSVDGGEPKYKLPAGFRKSLELFNLHRAVAQSLTGAGSTVVLVEGFFDCMKVWQSLYPCVVALMGSSLSEHQERSLLKQFTKVTLLLDGDAAGREAAAAIAERLVRKVHVRIVDLADGQQPDQLSKEELDSLLR